MAVNDELGKRMKEYYETVSKTKLTRRTPVAIRLDGRSFHSFTRGFNKPFDEVLIKSMQRTMQYLCENIQGCVLGYHQSDEITLILIDYKKLTSSAWFDYEVQKMCSIAASMATMAFNKFFADEVIHFRKEKFYNAAGEDQYAVYLKAVEKGAMFDARCFNIPKEEVCNLIYWRQLDATRNSIQMVGQANFSHKELQNKSCNQIQDMLMTERGINWNDLPVYQKRGSCCIKSNVSTTFANVDEAGNVTTGSIERPHWYIDNNIPIFKGEDREYIDKLIRVDDNCPCKVFIN
jgi:tRNA(His) 5'-end guanylyltransferase